MKTTYVAPLAEETKFSVQGVIAQSVRRESGSLTYYYEQDSEFA